MPLAARQPNEGSAAFRYAAGRVESATNNFDFGIRKCIQGYEDALVAPSALRF